MFLLPGAGSWRSSRHVRGDPTAPNRTCDQNSRKWGWLRIDGQALPAGILDGLLHLNFRLKLRQVQLLMDIF